MPGGDDTNEENLEGKEATPHDKSCPINADFGPWVLVTRKKKISRDLGKETTQLSSYGHQGPSKVGPSQSSSPTRPSFVHPEAERSGGTRAHVTQSAFRGSFADRASSVNGEDQSKLTHHHAPSKSHSRGQKSKPKTRNPAGARGGQMSSSDKEPGLPNADRSGSMRISKPMMIWRPTDQNSLDFHVFTAGSSDDLNKPNGLETGGSTALPDAAESMPSPAVGPLRDTPLQVQGRSGNEASVQAEVAANISRAALKRIDPALRAKSDSHFSDDNEDQLRADGDMLCDEGSDSLLV